ncbi:MAG: hypothetical protein QXI33_00810 [Candidatus Pacearchaeota archaeon]
MKGKKFPMLAVILLVVGIIWLLQELTIITINIPWIPIVLIIIALGLIINRYTEK